MHGEGCRFTQTTDEREIEFDLLPVVSSRHHLSVYVQSVGHDVSSSAYRTQQHCQQTVDRRLPGVHALHAKYVCDDGVIQNFLNS